MKASGFSCAVLGFALSALAFAPPIITRHDVPDAEYVAFAAEVPLLEAVIRYNRTDVAGTLIAPDWILSAAHVAETLSPGHNLLTLEGDSVEVKQIILHPGWVADGRPEDVALVQLAAPLSDRPLAQLYRGRDEVGALVIVAGNGDRGTGRTGPVENDGRMRAATNVVDDATDHYLIWRFDDPDDADANATPLEGISGPGDSSGPAFIRIGEDYFLAGISSGQSTAATGGLEGRYGVMEYYTRVSTYIDWITAVLDEH